jgi:hypothetical protein
LKLILLFIFFPRFLANSSAGTESQNLRAASNKPLPRNPPLRVSIPSTAEQSSHAEDLFRQNSDDVARKSWG